MIAKTLSSSHAASRRSEGETCGCAGRPSVARPPPHESCCSKVFRPYATAVPGRSARSEREWLGKLFVVPAQSVLRCDLGTHELRPPASFLDCRALLVERFARASIVEPPQASMVAHWGEAGDFHPIHLALASQLHERRPTPEVQTAASSIVACVEPGSVFARFAMLPYCTHEAHDLAGPDQPFFQLPAGPGFKGKGGSPRCDCWCFCWPKDEEPAFVFFDPGVQPSAGAEVHAASVDVQADEAVAVVVDEQVEAPHILDGAAVREVARPVLVEERGAVARDAFAVHGEAEEMWLESLRGSVDPPVAIVAPPALRPVIGRSPLGGQSPPPNAPGVAPQHPQPPPANPGGSGGFGLGAASGAGGAGFSAKVPGHNPGPSKGLPPAQAKAGGPAAGAGAGGSAGGMPAKGSALGGPRTPPSRMPSAAVASPSAGLVALEEDPPPGVALHFPPITLAASLRLQDGSSSERLSQAEELLSAEMVRAVLPEPLPVLSPQLRRLLSCASRESFDPLSPMEPLRAPVPSNRRSARTPRVASETIPLGPGMGGGLFATHRDAVAPYATGVARVAASLGLLHACGARIATGNLEVGAESLAAPTLSAELAHAQASHRAARHACRVSREAWEVARESWNEARQLRSLANEVRLQGRHAHASRLLRQAKAAHHNGTAAAAVSRSADREERELRREAAGQRARVEQIAPRLMRSTGDVAQLVAEMPVHEAARARDGRVAQEKGSSQAGSAKWPTS